MSIQGLLERAKKNGLTVFLEDGRVQVKAAHEPQGEARALINELREHRQEVLEALTQDDPILSVDAWLPEYLAFREKVYQRVKDSDVWGHARNKKPDLYAKLRGAESELDKLANARLSKVMELLKQWRALVLKIQLDEKQNRAMFL